MFTRPGTYVLRPEEVEAFGVEEVSVLYDRDDNAVVRSAGLLMGAIILNRDHPNPEVNRTGRPDIPYITDLAMAERSTGAIDRSRRGENARIRAYRGILTLAGTAPEEMEHEMRQHHRNEMQKIIDAEKRAINAEKREVVEELESAHKVSESTGKNVPKIVQGKLIRSSEGFSKRQSQIVGVGIKNERRKFSLKTERDPDNLAKKTLYYDSLKYSSISENTERYLEVAGPRRTLPGIHIVQNGLFHKDDSKSWLHVIIAQEGYEPLYPELMNVMHDLAGETITNLQANLGAAVDSYQDPLMLLEDTIDMIRIGYEYNLLAKDLMDLLWETQRLLLTGRLAYAIEMAKLYCFVLRYHAFPGQPPNKAWHTPLPRPKARQGSLLQPEDPFDDLPQ